MNEKKELLRVEHLKKYFPTPRGMLLAVDDISFCLNAGETLGVVGESGCGKSTLGRAILRLHEPTGGKVIFDGENILEYDKQKMKQKRSDMQIIFQDPYSSLNPRMTVSQSIAAPLLIQGVYKANEKDKIQKKVDEMMDLVGLAKRFANSYPHELDGGRRQRIGIARALSLNPKFIVCDEPVSALDVSIQAQVLNLMQDLQEKLGLTYLFITHNLSVVKHLSNRIRLGIWTDGRAGGAQRIVFKSTASLYKSTFISDSDSGSRSKDGLRRFKGRAVLSDQCSRRMQICQTMYLRDSGM